MAFPSYDKGDLVRVSAAFTNAAGTATDPTTVTLKYELPSGSETTLVYPTDAALVKDSTGNYHVDLSTTASGTWVWRFIGTGTVEQATEGVFFVKRSDF